MTVSFPCCGLSHIVAIYIYASYATLSSGIYRLLRVKSLISFLFTSCEMSDLNLNELPFYGFTDSEFMRATGTWVFHSGSLLTDSRGLFRSVIEFPDKDDINMNIIKSKYYNIKQTIKQFTEKSMSFTALIILP